MAFLYIHFTRIRNWMTVHIILFAYAFCHLVGKPLTSYKIKYILVQNHVSQHKMLFSIQFNAMLIQEIKILLFLSYAIYM